MSHLEIPTHLRKVGTTINSKTWGVRCDEDWPCKRMSCQSCAYRRRNAFVREGHRFSERHDLHFHFVVSWPLQPYEDAWGKLLTQSSILSKAASPKVGKFVRSLGIGHSDRTPHIHYLVSQDAALFLRETARRVGPPETLIYPKVLKVAPDVGELLGYFFDRNFLPTYLDLDRPKGIRILSGYRGMSYGFPKYRACRRSPQ